VRFKIAGMQVPNYAADDYVSEFSKMYADLAAKTAPLPCRRCSPVFPVILFESADGVHRTPLARSVLAENVWRILRADRTRDVHRAGGARKMLGMDPARPKTPIPPIPSCPFTAISP
jgi:hypothetical protein